MSKPDPKEFKNRWKLRLWGCREHLFDHWDAVGGSYGRLWSIFMDLGVILDSILRAISVRICVIFEAIFWLVVGCVFFAVVDQFSGRFWCVLEQKCGLPWNMWDCEKPMFYVMNSMISRVWGLFVEPKSVAKHTWNRKWVLKLFFVDLTTWGHFGIHFGTEIR